MKCECPNCNNKSVSLVIKKRPDADIECENDFKELRLNISTDGRKLHLCPQHWKLALAKFLYMISTHTERKEPLLPTP
ncbi:MAG: hypothetical protein E3J72_09285 [Planctomycetota bacterium]|nr:MAG: hypothetical protein E3J72_09285 [Planctomycetota bacterium]